MLILHNPLPNTYGKCCETASKNARESASLALMWSMDGRV
jgi:hypothetical protein